MRLATVGILGGLLAASPLAAQRDTAFAAFHLPRDGGRGAASDVATLSYAAQAAIYRTVAIAFVSPSAESAPWLDPSLLPNGGGYGRLDSMPQRLVQELLSAHRFHGVCRTSDRLGCTEAGGSYAFSRIFQVEPGAVRLFVSYVSLPPRSDSSSRFVRAFATEEVFRLEQQRGRWTVTKHATVMIT